jgi:Mn2+/Fe2+ NRAMP family transporter
MSQQTRADETTAPRWRLIGPGLVVAATGVGAADLVATLVAGFWAAAMSSLVGVWNGVSLMFADFMGNVTGKASDDPDSRAGGKWYRLYILWLTFPPMVMMFLGEPVWLILAYGVLGAFFMPFLAVTLLWLLNTDRTPAQWRNRAFSNIALAVVTLTFAALAVNEIRKAIALI